MPSDIAGGLADHTTRGPVTPEVPGEENQEPAEARVSCGTVRPPKPAGRGAQRAGDGARGKLSCRTAWTAIEVETPGQSQAAGAGALTPKSSRLTPGMGYAPGVNSGTGGDRAPTPPGPATAPAAGAYMGYTGGTNISPPDPIPPHPVLGVEGYTRDVWAGAENAPAQLMPL